MVWSLWLYLASGQVPSDVLPFKINRHEKKSVEVSQVYSYYTYIPVADLFIFIGFRI